MRKESPKSQTNKFVDDAKNLAFGAILGGTEKCHPLLPLTADDDVFQDVDADLDDGDNDEDDDGDKIYLESVLLGELSLATAAAAACLVITSLAYDDRESQLRLKICVYSTYIL